LFLAGLFIIVRYSAGKRSDWAMASIATRAGRVASIRQTAVETSMLPQHTVFSILSSSKFGWLIPQQVILSVAKDLDPGAPGRRFFATQILRFAQDDNARSQ